MGRMNGKPGDDLVLDILTHGLKVFGEPCDGLIRQIVERFGRGPLDKEIPLLPKPPKEGLEKRLRALQNRLNQDAKERGWERP